MGIKNSVYKDGFHMPQEVSAKCKKLIDKYNKCKLTSRKQQARNDLYMQMRGYLVVWINSLLKKWGHYKEEHNIISESWSAFEFCLSHYKPGYTVQGHFYTYTRYFLLSEYAKKDNVHISVEELKTILTEFPTPENQHFERLLTLYQFRDVIPDKCRLIWDHALLVAGGKTIDAGCYEAKWMNTQYSKNGFTKNAYYAVRSSYVNIIKLILGIKQ